LYHVYCYWIGYVGSACVCFISPKCSTEKYIWSNYLNFAIIMVLRAFKHYHYSLSLSLYIYIYIILAVWNACSVLVFPEFIITCEDFLEACSKLYLYGNVFSVVSFFSVLLLTFDYIRGILRRLNVHDWKFCIYFCLLPHVLI
jgi:hypothetical protein